MKKFLLILFVGLALASCENKQKQIIAYNDAIISEEEALIQAESRLVEALNNRTINVLDSNYNGLLNQIMKSENKLNEIEEMDAEVGLKQGAAKLFSLYKTQTQTGYKELVELSKIPDSLYTARQAKQFEEISSTLFITLNAEVNAFIATQNKLAEKYKFQFKK